jgi:hypothetical protein
MKRPPMKRKHVWRPKRKPCKQKMKPAVQQKSELEEMRSKG